MNNKDKICIIGLGYWGKIILNNLNQLGYKNILICENRNIDWSEIGRKYPLVKDYKSIPKDYKKVFVLTPAKTHYEICYYFLSLGCDVFCEKPLDINPDACLDLYNVADLNKSYLFVDWLFTFNPALEVIKNISFTNPIKSIKANRLNYGPIRYDVGARYDLAAHDVSIAIYLLDKYPSKIKWHDFSRDKSSMQKDSCIGFMDFDNQTVQIDCSWSYPVKDRLYTIELENSIIYWDDAKKYIHDSNGENIPFNNESPIHRAIKTFFDKKITQKNFTYNIARILNHEN
jgi:predicted dehydrogenase